MTHHLITHHGIRIITLTTAQAVAAHCAPGQTAIREHDDGGWLYFMDQDGTLDGDDSPFTSHAEALRAAKAAAQFSAQ